MWLAASSVTGTEQQACSCCAQAQRSAAGDNEVVDLRSGLAAAEGCGDRRGCPGRSVIGVGRRRVGLGCGFVGVDGEHARYLKRGAASGSRRGGIDDRRDWVTRGGGGGAAGAGGPSSERTFRAGHTLPAKYA